MPEDAFQLRPLPEKSLQAYVDRRSDRALLNALTEVRRYGRPWLVTLTGPPAHGKTYAVQRHAEAIRRLFGDVLYVHVDYGLNRIGTRVADLKGGLLIIDDFDGLDHSSAAASLTDAVRNILEGPRPVDVLLVGRQVSFPWPDPIEVKVHPFSLEETSELAERILGRVKPGEAEMLWLRVNGAPLLTTLTLQGIADGYLQWPAVLGPISGINTGGLFGPDGRPLSESSHEVQEIVADVRGVSFELLRKLAATPDELYKVSPRLFEEVLMEIFSRKGYEVTLTPASKDGGKDIYAVRKDSGVTFLTLIEAKRYAPDRPVGVELIRSLYGVVEEEKASAGILATTSYFTKGAREFQHRVRFRISLQDFVGLQQLLREVAGG